MDNSGRDSQYKQETVEIPLSKGYVAVVDAIDADLLASKWHIYENHHTGKMYASRFITRDDKRTNEYLHRAIVAKQLGKALTRDDRIEHIDGDGLNNRRTNLKFIELVGKKIEQPSFNVPLSEVIQIPLAQGYTAIVDPIDADLANMLWHSTSLKGSDLIYAQGHDTVDGKRTTILIHRIILGRMLGRSLGRNELVDHVDRNGLNCCRKNLRLSTPSQNQHNQKRNSKNTSGYKGVFRDKRSGKWVAQITVHGKKIHLGEFDSPEVAHQAYCNAAEEHFGDFARFD